VNRREAKKAACANAAANIFDAVESLAATWTDERDRDRIREASYELSAELYRRAGLESDAARVDERQLSIYDVEGV
jgi:hypothetical protein